MLYRIDKFITAPLLVYSIATGCGGISSAEIEEEQTCSPGQTARCRCPDDKRGERVCLDAGSYSSCRCDVSEGEDSIKGTRDGSTNANRLNQDDSGMSDDERADASGDLDFSNDAEPDAEEEERFVDAGEDMDAAAEEEQESGDDGSDADSRDAETTTDAAKPSGQQGKDASTGSGGSGANGGSGGETGAGGGSGTVDYDDYEYFCEREPTSLPTPTEPCPTIVTTYVDETTSNPLTFRGKQTEIFVEENPDPKKKGPVVFYWHGLGGHPNEVLWGLGVESGLEILARGGMVVAMYADETASGGSIAVNWDNGHLDAADEILACAIEQIGVDTCRIHAMGFSDGGLMTTQMSYRRSNYIASVVVYSGGIYLRAPAHQDPNNKFAAMIVHGGADDVVGISFETTSTAYLNDLRGKGHFAFTCSHGSGHTVPDSIIAPAWQFLKDHPYGVTPEPYQASLPALFPNYCSL